MKRKAKPWDYRSKEEYNFSLNCIGFTAFGLLVLIVIAILTSKKPHPQNQAPSEVVYQNGESI